MIDTEALRKKVIDIAIQGKLTEQLPSDGDAETLYAQILDQKSQLIKEGKIKKDKELPDIAADEIPFEVPKNWKWVRIGEISAIVSKGTTPRGGNVAYLDSGIGFLRVENLVGYDKIDKSSLKFIDEETHNGFLKRSILEAGDVLISIAGTLGKTGLVREEDLPLNTNQAIAFIRLVNKLKVDGEYISYILNALTVQKELGNRKVAMAIPNLSLEVISKAIIPLPPLEEQKRIVNVLRRSFLILDEIDSLQAKYSNDLVVLRNKIIDAGIRGKLTEQLPEDGDAEKLYAEILDQKAQLNKEGKLKKEKPLPEIEADEIPFEIPKNWKWVRLGAVSTIINGDRGKNYPAKSTLSKEGIPFISALNLNGESVDEDDRLLCLSDEQYEKLGNGKLQKDDIVICIRGSLGKHGRYPFEKGAIASSLVICRPYCFADELGEYIMKWLDCSLFVKEINRYNGGAAQPNLAAENLKKFLVPLPPLSEQKRIAHKINEMLLLIN